MQPYITIPCPTGGTWELETATGGVANYDGAPFFGSLPGVGVKASSPVVSLGPLVQDGAVTGYWITDVQGHVYAFGAAPYLGGIGQYPQLLSPGQLVIGVMQESGDISPIPVRYKQRTWQPSDGPDKFREYHWPVGA